VAYTGKFVTPGPGSWEREQTHFVQPISRYLGDIFPAAMTRGFREMTSRYGILLDYIELAVVDGFVYTAPRPVGAPKAAKGPPPKPVFKLMTWLHPEIRRRIKRSREALETKIWRDDVRMWDAEIKPSVAKTNARLGALEPGSVTDEALTAHLRECRRALDNAIYQHHRLNGCCMLPIGEYLAEAAEWTGLPTSELLEPFRGSSPVSIGAREELERLSAALRKDDAARALLAEGREAGEVLRAVRETKGDVGEAARAYLDVVGYRITTGYDVADRFGLEMPEVLTRAIRKAVDDTEVRRDGEGPAAAKVRDAVPVKHRDRFDELLREARLVFRIRDERCYLNDALTTGITRVAILEAGKRLASRDRVADPGHAVELAPDELVAVLAGRDREGPSRDELADFNSYRASKSYLDAPEFLGNPPSGPPPAEWLPPHAARMQRAVTIILGSIFGARAAESEREGAKPSAIVKGLGVGGGVYEGRARLVLSPLDFPKVQQGDVLVARATAPAYNVLLPLLGALVTDRGGLLSHPAIVAREYGLPAVVGCVDATAKIKDDVRVRVDGSKGEVSVLQAPS
jgi:pyruvate,water dikinase